MTPRPDVPQPLGPTPRPLLSRRESLRRAAILAAPGLLWGLPAALRAQPQPKPRVVNGYTELRWEDLVPKGWDPMKGLRERGITNAAALDDADPKVQALMQALRESWDTAPTEAALNGSRIRLPGYVVPLEDDQAGLREFLLVPYFGACIHSPPPPANQIVLVALAKPAPGFKTMDTVWASGVLRAQRADSPMGTSGYRLEAAQVARYQAPGGR